MIEKIYLGSILVFFILAFAIRNIKTAFSTGLSLKGKSMKLTISIFFSTIIYLGIALRLTVLTEDSFFELNISDNEIVKYSALSLVTLGFAIGIAALIAMRNSWRVGIRYDQKTDLVTYGIYRFSRNPYFLSYYILMLGFVLFFPSVFLIVPYLVILYVFHSMILEEEKYLEKMHGENYLNYKNKVNRYVTLL
jgi:protein-S-isoprenylcysteine O-methyltransferase Ste14